MNCGFFRVVDGDIDVVVFVIVSIYFGSLFLWLVLDFLCLILYLGNVCFG